MLWASQFVFHDCKTRRGKKKDHCRDFRGSHCYWRDYIMPTKKTISLFLLYSIEKTAWLLPSNLLLIYRFSVNQMGILFSSAEVTQSSHWIALTCVLCSSGADKFSLQQDAEMRCRVQSWAKGNFKVQFRLHVILNLLLWWHSSHCSVVNNTGHMLAVTGCWSVFLLGNSCL